MSEKLKDYIVSDLYPKLTVHEIEVYLSHLTPVSKNTELVTMHCPKCINPNSEHYLGTGIIVCKKCGTIDICSTLEDHLLLKKEDFILELSKSLNITIPQSISVEMKKSKPKIIASIKNIAQLKTDLDLERQGLSYNDFRDNYILIGNKQLLLNKLEDTCEYLPKKITELIKQCDINKPLIAINNNGKLVITDIKESDLGIFSRFKENKLFMTDDPVFFSILINNKKTAFLLGTKTTNKYLYETLINKKFDGKIIGVWKQKKNYQRIAKTIKYNIINHYYDWYEKGIDNCYVSLKKEFFIK
ncbi:hypothetical protein AYY20_16775 [Photobacterium aquimaris]|nr:hypothetical protein [Photobacterium aquimaris]OBU19986.1 hypothetical protein AYY20_16775 [Photobacterium aquimaris]